MDLPLFIREFRRRRVGRVVVSYGIASFAVLQVAEPVLHALKLEDWLLTVLVLALALGFPVAVGLAWAFDLQPGGVERTAPLAGQRSSPVLPVLLLGLGAAALPGVAWFLVRGPATGLPRWVVPSAMALLVVAIVAVVRVVRERGPASSAGARVPSVAVLPFADLSPGHDQAWFCDGIAEEILSALCCVPGLRVVSRSSSFQFRGREVDARDLGRALGATTLLEGSVRRAGGRVRVSARLVDARRGFDLWSENFDRQLEDTFAVQEEIAVAAVRALRLRIGGREAARLRRVGSSRGTRDPRAHELYLRGRFALMRHGQKGTQDAREAFLQVVALDPGFVQAHAGLADADVIILTWNFDAANAEALRSEALASSETALRLDPDLAEAWLAHANVLTLLGRMEDADADFRRAIELNPGWGDACYFHARALASTGRDVEAAEAFEEAVRRNPDDYASLTLLEGVHRKRGDLAAARDAGLRGLAAAERRLAIDPNDVRALYLGAGLDLNYGDRDRGFLRVERAVALGVDFATLYNAACFYVRARDPDRALELLDRAVGDGRGSRIWIEQDPDFAPLRADARFGAILARVKG